MFSAIGFILQERIDKFYILNAVVLDVGNQNLTQRYYSPFHWKERSIVHVQRDVWNEISFFSVLARARQTHSYRYNEDARSYFFIRDAIATFENLRVKKKKKKNLQHKPKRIANRTAEYRRRVTAMTDSYIWKSNIFDTRVAKLHSSVESVL